MICKTITYTDYNGNERTEKFYFNLTQTEIAELELGTTGGLTEYVERIVSTQDTPSLMTIFKELILKSYGEKSPDGRRFVKKNGALAEEFAETEAFSQLFMELAQDAEKASEFFNGIVPKIEEKAADNVTALPANN